jgi:two-component system, chemotaxis family, sensor kinase CheA
MRWLETLDLSGELPQNAEEVSSGLSVRFRGFLPEGPGAGAPDAGPGCAALGQDWIAGLAEADRLAAEAALADGPLVAVEYLPAETSFFRGEDPLLIALRLPGRVWFRVDTVEPLAPSPTFDPYRCVPRFRALTTAPRVEFERHMHYVASDVRLGTIGGDACGKGGATPGDGGRNAARFLLETQIEALDLAGDTSLAEGRVRSAAGVASAALRALGHAAAPGIATAPEEARAAGVPGPLQAHLAAALAALLADGPQTVLPAPEAPVQAVELETGDRGPVASAPGAGAPPRRASVLKVDQARVDAIMQLARELIVAKNALPFLARQAEEAAADRRLVREIKAQHEVFNRIAGDLQAAVMQIRMVPVATVFDRFRRLVRDLSRQLDKPFDLVIEGEETEADKSIVEDLGDPLVHLVRNACDHGLEAEEERRAAGKVPRGRLRLSARQSGDRVPVAVADDGRGIDAARVRAKAVERGLATAEAVAAMSDEEVFRFILQPGLSTAAQVSDLSGWGVGMDIVNTVVQRCGGHIALLSRPGEGTTVTVSLPVSVSVRRVMVVDAGEASYGIALDQIVEMVKVAPAQVHRHADHARIVLRDRLIPLVDMRRALRLPAAATGDESLSVVVVSTEAGDAGLMVDGFRASAEIIPKPLHGPLTGIVPLGRRPHGRRQRAAAHRCEGVGGMPLVTTETRPSVSGVATVEEAEALFTVLEAGAGVVDLSEATHLHAAVLQVPFAYRPDLVPPLTGTDLSAALLGAGPLPVARRDAA